MQITKMVILENLESSTSQPPVLWVVIPCYNESEVLPETAPLFGEELAQLVSSGRVADRSKILLVDDGSKDGTWNLIEELSRSDERFVGMSLSRNFGHQGALLGGLMEARHHCDITISIDCDGQDDVTVMREMVDAYHNGFEVVYGVRGNRDSDTAFKRSSAEAFYKLVNALGGEVVFNHADYRLLSARALNELAKFEEANLFLRGLVPLVGFPSTEVLYVRSERVAGESHYPLRKMLALALDGITGLSAKPMRLIMYVGFLFFVLGIAAAIWAIANVVAGNAIAGWASTFCLIGIIGGLQLLAIGIVGEYVGKIYMETKRRPRYIVQTRTDTFP